jgi:hypothetical protein
MFPRIYEVNLICVYLRYLRDINNYRTKENVSRRFRGFSQNERNKICGICGICVTFILQNKRKNFKLISQISAEKQNLHLPAATA